VGRLEQWTRPGGLRITYDSTIPRMVTLLLLGRNVYPCSSSLQVGLSGSSAIVVATFEALLRYFGMTIGQLHIDINGINNSLSTLQFIVAK
jgi:mevalonate kinase